MSEKNNPLIPLSAIRPIAVEAIRAVTGAADVGGPPGPYLTDEMERVAAAAADHFRGVTKMVEQEPFGYFRPMLDGWEDCAEGDYGAVALYDRPQVKAPTRRDRCGKDNPADIHTCTSLAVRLAEDLRQGHFEMAMFAADELCRLSAEWYRLSSDIDLISAQADASDKRCAELEIENNRLKQHMDALNEWCVKDKELIGELLEALEKLVAIHHEPSGLSGKYGKALDAAIDAHQQKIDARLLKARAAIAKATGQTI